MPETRGFVNGMVFFGHMEKRGTAPPEQREDTDRTLAPEELAAFTAAYDRARLSPSRIPDRAQVPSEVRDLREARAAFLLSVAHQLDAPV